MKDDKYFWSYEKEPGRALKKDYLKDTNQLPLVSIVTSYYNAHEFMEQTINCVLNQTFPYWEWIIVDDGSTDKCAIEYLKEVEKIDTRIHVYHKENEGLAKGRDYAIENSKSDYILPLDADDLIEPTYIETLYWAMQTNPNATWAFTNSVGFGRYIYLADYKFDSDKMKNENQITATALIRKEKILSLNGYGVAKRYVNEDWHLWLRMLARGDYPIQITYYGFWYRRREESLLTEINDTQNEQNKKRLKDLKEVADKITNKIEPVIFQTNNISELEYFPLDWEKDLLMSSSKEVILYILPNTTIDKKVYKEIKIKAKQKDIIIVTLDCSDYSHYALRQKYEEFAIVFNLDTFLDKKYFLGFIEYVIKTRKINDIYVSEDYKDISVIQDKNVQIVKFKENKFLYKYEIAKYKAKHTLLGRAIRKIMKG